MTGGRRAVAAALVVVAAVAWLAGSARTSTWVFTAPAAVVPRDGARAGGYEYDILGRELVVPTVAAIVARERDRVGGDVSVSASATTAVLVVTAEHPDVRAAADSARTVRDRGAREVARLGGLFVVERLAEPAPVRSHPLRQPQLRTVAALALAAALAVAFGRRSRVSPAGAPAP